MLAGRSLPAIMVACSLAANNVGGGSTVGLASKAYGNWGMSAVWYVLAGAIGIIPMAFFAPKLRRVMAYTIPEVVGRRFGTTSHVITAVLNVVSLFCFTASQMLASGIIISALVGINIKVAIIIAGVFTLVYTIMGGLWADAFTDLFQWFIIFFGLLIAVPFVIHGAGGWTAIMAKVPAQKMSLNGMGLVFVLSLIGQFFITFMSGPEMVSRIYCAKDEKTGRNATLLSGLFMGLFAFIPAVLGIIAFAALPGIEGSQALSSVVFKFAPGWVAGLVCAAVIASTMSSADSDMLCCSTIIVKDLYQKYINPKIEDDKLIKMTRISNVVVGLGAMCIALFQINIITLNLFSFMLRAAGPFGAFILGLTLKRVSKHAGLAGILAGGIMGIIWQLAKEPFHILAIIAGSVVGVVVLLVFSYFELKFTNNAAPDLE
jgi:SSS family solute:Na+ symporter